MAMVFPSTGTAFSRSTHARGVLDQEAAQPSGLATVRLMDRDAAPSASRRSAPWRPSTSTAGLAKADTQASAIPAPSFGVNPNGDGVGGWEWVPDDSVHVAIDDLDADALPDFEFDAPTDEWGEFSEWDIGYDIQAGYSVNVTQGTTTKSHVVTVLEVTDVDSDADTVSGTAAAGSEVEVYAWTDEGGVAAPKRVATANGSGVWIADFSEPADPGSGDPDEDRIWNLVASSEGMARQLDNDNDSTQIDWNVPNPTFTVRPDGDGVAGREWVPDDSVHVAIDDLDADALPDFEFDAPTDEWGEFDEWDIGYDIQVGYNVSVTQGATTKTHKVTAITVTVSILTPIRSQVPRPQEARSRSAPTATSKTARNRGVS